MIQKRLEKSTRLLNDLKNHCNWILIYSDEKLSPLTLCSTKDDLIVTYGKDVSEHSTVSTIKRIYNLDHDAWRRSIKRGEDASGFLNWLQANVCRLQRSFGVESYCMGQEDH